MATVQVERSAYACACMQTSPHPSKGVAIKLSAQIPTIFLSAWQTASLAGQTLSGEHVYQSAISFLVYLTKSNSRHGMYVQKGITFCWGMACGKALILYSSLFTLTYLFLLCWGFPTYQSCFIGRRNVLRHERLVISSMVSP